MAQKLLPELGYLLDFTGGQGAGAANYFDYPDDMDINFALIQASVNQMIDELTGIQGQNGVLPLDLLQSTSPSIDNGRIGNHSYLTVINGTNLDVDDGAAIAGGLRYEKKAGTTSLSAVGKSAGTLYVSLNSSGLVTLEEAAAQDVIDLYSVSWDTVTLTGLTELVPPMPDGDDFQDCLTVAGSANGAGFDAQTHVKIADRFENIERLLSGQTTNIDSAESDLGPIVIGGSAATPALITGIAGTADTGTGLFRIAADQLGFAAGGVEKWEIAAGGLLARFDGSAGAPPLARAADQDTGLFWTGTLDQLGFSAGGIEAFRISEASSIAQLLLGTTGTELLPVLAREGDPDTGLNLPGADVVDIITKGVVAVSVNARQIVTSTAQPAGYVRRDGAQNIGNNTATAIDLTAEDFDRRSQHDTVLNPDRVTLKLGEDGLYTFSGGVTFDESSGSGAGSVRRVEITVNGTAFARSNHPGDGTADNEESVSVTLDLVENDIVRLVATQDSGGAMDITNSYLSWTRTY